MHVIRRQIAHLPGGDHMLMTDLAILRGARATRRTQRGVTLLESLVSIVILAIGVLGLLGVQVRTLAENQQGVRRAQAVRLIEDLAERAKSNPGRFKEIETYISDWEAAPAEPGSCADAPCAADALAQFDIWQWRKTVAETLPAGDARVFSSPDEAADDTNRRQLGVMVAWRANERRLEGDSDGDHAQYVAPFALSSGTADVTCPTGLICHIVYVQL